MGKTGIKFINLYSGKEFVCPKMVTQNNGTCRVSNLWLRENST